MGRVEEVDLRQGIPRKESLSKNDTFKSNLTWNESYKNVTCLGVRSLNFGAFQNQCYGGG